MLFKNEKNQQKTPPTTAPIPAEKTVPSAENILASSLFYRLKRDVLELVASMNQGVTHLDCELIKRQTMFVQTQLFHSLFHDPSFPANLKMQLMDYHAKNIRATIGDRRGEQSRETV